MVEIIDSDGSVDNSFLGLDREQGSLREAIRGLQSSAGNYRRKAEAYFHLYPSSRDSRDVNCDGVTNLKIGDLYEIAATDVSLVLIKLRRGLERINSPWLVEASNEAIDERIRETDKRYIHKAFHSGNKD